jgi:hypothetical protein
LPQGCDAKNTEDAKGKQRSFNSNSVPIKSLGENIAALRRVNGIGTAEWNTITDGLIELNDNDPEENQQEADMAIGIKLAHGNHQIIRDITINSIAQPDTYGVPLGYTGPGGGAEQDTCHAAGCVDTKMDTRTWPRLSQCGTGGHYATRNRLQRWLFSNPCAARAWRVLS